MRQQAPVEKHKMRAARSSWALVGFARSLRPAGRAAAAASESPLSRRPPPSHGSRGRAASQLPVCGNSQDPEGPRRGGGRGAAAGRAGSKQQATGSQQKPHFVCWPVLLYHQSSRGRRRHAASCWLMTSQWRARPLAAVWCSLNSVHRWPPRSSVVRSRQQRSSLARGRSSAAVWLPGC
jgi:hypothetical protein